MNIKICNKCGRWLQKESNFFKHKFAKDGYENICKECVKARRKKRYKNIIYEIYCIQTDKYYIGQTIKNLSERISKHFSDAKRGRNQPLYIDILKYGKENFKYKEICEAKTESELNDLERYYISKYIEEGKILYNREAGGKDKTTMFYESKIKMSRSKNIKPFYVLNKDDLSIIGEFQTIKEAMDDLKVSGLKRILDKNKGYTKNITCIYKDEYNEISISELKDRIKFQKNKRSMLSSGKNNAMYGMVNEKNPNSKCAYIVKNNKIIEKFKTIKDLKAKYGYTSSEICRGKNNNYYKKFDIFIYNENNIPKSIREQGKEVSYN